MSRPRGPQPIRCAALHEPSPGGTTIGASRLEPPPERRGSSRGIAVGQREGDAPRGAARPGQRRRRGSRVRDRHLDAGAPPPRPRAPRRERRRAPQATILRLPEPRGATAPRRRPARLRPRPASPPPFASALPVPAAAPRRRAFLARLDVASTVPSIAAPGAHPPAPGGLPARLAARRRPGLPDAAGGGAPRSRWPRRRSRRPPPGCSPPWDRRRPGCCPGRHRTRAGPGGRLACGAAGGERDRPVDTAPPAAGTGPPPRSPRSPPPRPPGDRAPRAAARHPVAPAGGDRSPGAPRVARCRRPRRQPG